MRNRTQNLGIFLVFPLLIACQHDDVEINTGMDSETMDTGTGEMESDTMTFISTGKVEGDTETMDTGTGEVGESDTGTGEVLEESDTGTGEIEPNNETETNPLITIKDDCDNFAFFIDACYNTFDWFKGPTQTLIQKSCGSSTISQDAAEWFYCWKKPLDDFQCDNNYPPFESLENNSCDHYMKCMAWCFM